MARPNPKFTAKIRLDLRTKKRPSPFIKSDDVVLGRTLAETAELNSPEYLAEVEASGAVQRARPGAESIARNRRWFRIAELILFLFLASIIAAIWLAEWATQGS